MTSYKPLKSGKGRYNYNTPKTEYVETPSPTTLWRSVLSRVKSSPFLLWQAWPCTISGFSIFSFNNSRFRRTERGTVWCSPLADIFVHSTPSSLNNFQTRPNYTTTTTISGLMLHNVLLFIIPNKIVNIVSICFSSNLNANDAFFICDQQNHVSCNKGKLIS